MWLCVLTTLLACSYVQTNTQKGPRNAEWGWHMQQHGPSTTGHYYVKLPQAEQQVHYIADGSGYHPTLSLHTSGNQHTSQTNFALGRRALELDNQIPFQAFTSRIPNESLETSATSDLRAVQNPLEFFVYQTHYPTAQPQTQVFQFIPEQLQNIVQYNPSPNFYYNEPPKAEYYNYQVHDKLPNMEQNNNYVVLNQNKNSETGNKNLNNKQNEPIEVVQVFKDLNCSKKDDTRSDTKQNLNENIRNDVTVHGNFGEKETKNVYKGTVHFKVDPPSNERKERLYYSSISGSTTPQSVTFTEEEGISRLVASTQDLISNEDLLKINHAIETSVYPHNDDLIKPKPRYSIRSKNYDSRRTVPQSHVSVSTSHGNIVNTKTNHDSYNKKQTDERAFNSPIVVAESNNDNFKNQALNNLISTMVPYMEDGYELVGIKNSLDEGAQATDEDLVNITPRPISQNYLTPITVALRLLAYANDTIFQDHDISESENVPETTRPDSERTIVEIQQSIPLEITHINDIEYHHEYMEEGRSNRRPYHYGKALYNHNRDQFEHNQQNQISQFNDRKKKNSNDNEQSGNSYTEVRVHPNEETNQRNFHDHQQILQPIIIEKEVPVTKFVDRYIEKQVPYPEPVEVVKEVPVDRPVPIPIRYDTIVEKPVEVTKYIDKPYPVEVLKPYPVEVKVPYPVEHKVYVDRPVHVPYPVEKVVEKNVIHPVAVPTPVAIPVPVEQKVLYPVAIEKRVPVPVEVEKPVERIVHKEVAVPYPVEKRVPVPYPVERRIPVPVEKIVEKPVTKIVEKHIKVPVPHPVPYEVHVPKPYPVDRIVEKKVPYPVHIDRIVEKKVPVQVPYPVNTVVEKIVEKPVVVTKYIEKPYPVEKRVPYPVERIVEKKVPYPVPVSYPQQKPDSPYQYEQIDPSIYYGYGNGGYQPGHINYIPLHTVSTLQQNQNMQQQAESQRNYQIQKASDEYLKNYYKQNIPVHTTLWGNQYASSYSYLNNTNNVPTNYIQNDQKYYGPPPTKAYNFTWEKNQDFDKRRNDRVPKNLRIEYGGFKPPLIPSTEVDLDGNPVKNTQ